MDHDPERKLPSTVLVTGAGSGMGLESALFLSRKGFAVWGSVLNPVEAAALRDEAQRRQVPVRVLQIDITKQHEIEAAVRALLKEEGRIDALVHFAGVSLWGFFEDLTLEEVRRVHDVNVFGAMAITQAVLPHMRVAGAGRIVMTSSTLGRISAPGSAAYTSSKFALEGFMECLALEMAPFGIRVSLLEPGLVQTPIFGVNRMRAKRATAPDSPYYAWFCQLEKHMDALLRRQLLTPADVAKITYKILASARPRLRYVVGTRVKLILSLRRHLPGGLFDRLWSSLIRRLFTASRHPPKSLR
jgi:NAD(P)-dependent dehydrogenase (short-subunit alcohol dehydrogenase family)